jgi:(p)ppGpp synthase/HD superfamily hydrolase
MESYNLAKTYASTLEFAQYWHGEQQRKYTKEPYWVHLLQVGSILESIQAHSDVVMAGILHDLLEDTSATYVDIEKEFGSKVASLVLEVSDKSTVDDGNRAIRKEIDRLHLAEASTGGKNIKLADMISNVPGIVNFDPSFAKIYILENELLLEVLTGGNEELLDRAREHVRREKSSLLIRSKSQAVSRKSYAERNPNS